MIPPAICGTNGSRKEQWAFGGGRQKLNVTSEYVEHRYPFKKERLAWEDVAVIEGDNFDKFTYSELCLLILDVNRDALVVGELEKGFDALERMIFEKFPTFPRSWKGDLETKGIGARDTLWSREPLSAATSGDEHASEMRR